MLRLDLGKRDDGLSQGSATEGKTLAALLAETASGNHSAFRALYEATGPKLLGVVLRITRNRPTAEEVVQETFIKIWQNAERFDPAAGSPLGWLVAIARNRAIDRIRSERIDRARATDDDQILERLSAPMADDPVTREALRTCLGRLDDEARNCVVLAYCSGLSREELAERFGRPVGTIKTVLHRSVRLLRECLETG